MNSGTLLIRNRLQTCSGVEYLRRVYNLATMGYGRQEAKYKTEAVEKWWWTAQDIFVREAHSVTNKSTVVQDRVMSQHSSFRVTCGPTRELQIAYIVIGESGVQVIQQPVIEGCTPLN